MPRHFTIRTFALLTIMSVVSFNVSSADKKDCIDCNYKKVVGAPEVAGLDGISKIVKASYQSNDFEGYHQSFCLRFEHISHKFAFKREMLDAMKKTPYSIEKFWTQSGCNPNKIGGTDTPIGHLVAEDVGGRTQFLQALHKYFIEQKDEKAWLKVVNAKNSRGFTLLDYIVYLHSTKQYAADEREQVNELLAFVCSKGGTFAVSADKKCPMSI